MLFLIIFLIVVSGFLLYRRCYPQPVLSQSHNPVIKGVDLADPAVIRYDGKFYMYPTAQGHKHYDVYESTDLFNWTNLGCVLKLPDAPLWAPDVFYDKISGLFYFYYSANFKIGVAVAASPIGPFEDKGILIKDAIDAHVFQDDDGKIYLYYEAVNPKKAFKNKQWPKGVLMVQTMSDWVTKEGEPRLLFVASHAWEKSFVPIVEAPWMIKHQGRYYLMYSANLATTKGYAIGYATSDHPLGPFEKYDGNPIASAKPGVIGPGHHAVVQNEKGEYWMVYHQKVNYAFNFDRRICVDRLFFNDDGTITVNTTPMSAY